MNIISINNETLILHPDKSGKNFTEELYQTPHIINYRVYIILLIVQNVSLVQIYIFT